MVTVECVILGVCPPYLETSQFIRSLLRRHISSVCARFPSYCSVMTSRGHKKRALFTCEQYSFLGVELLNHLFSSMYSVVYYEGKKYAYSTPHICSQVLTYSA